VYRLRSGHAAAARPRRVRGDRLRAWPAAAAGALRGAFMRHATTVEGARDDDHVNRARRRRRRRRRVTADFGRVLQYNIILLFS